MPFSKELSPTTQARYDVVSHLPKEKIDDATFHKNQKLLRTLTKKWGKRGQEPAVSLLPEDTSIFRQTHNELKAAGIRTGTELRVAELVDTPPVVVAMQNLARVERQTWEYFNQPKSTEPAVNISPLSMEQTIQVAPTAQPPGSLKQRTLVTSGR